MIRGMKADWSIFFSVTTWLGCSLAGKVLLYSRWTLTYFNFTDPSSTVYHDIHWIHPHRDFGTLCWESCTMQFFWKYLWFSCHFNFSSRLCFSCLKHCLCVECITQCEIMLCSRLYQCERECARACVLLIALSSCQLRDALYKSSIVIIIILSQQQFYNVRSQIEDLPLRVHRSKQWCL